MNDDKQSSKNRSRRKSMFGASNMRSFMRKSTVKDELGTIVYPLNTYGNMESSAKMLKKMSYNIPLSNLY